MKNNNTNNKLKTKLFCVLSSLIVVSSVNAQHTIGFDAYNSTNDIVDGSVVSTSDPNTTLTVNFDTTYPNDPGTVNTGVNYYTFGVAYSHTTPFETKVKFSFNNPVDVDSIRLFDFGTTDVTFTSDVAISLTSPLTSTGWTSTQLNSNSIKFNDVSTANNTLSQLVSFAGPVSYMEILVDNNSVDTGGGGGDWGRIQFPSGFNSVPEPSSATFIGLAFIFGLSRRRR